jgi:hypothetical protein
VAEKDHVSLPQAVVGGFGWKESEVPSRLRDALVMDLLRFDRLSEAQAAAILGVARWELLELMGRYDGIAASLPIIAAAISSSRLTVWVFAVTVITQLGARNRLAHLVGRERDRVAAKIDQIVHSVMRATRLIGYSGKIAFTTSSIARLLSVSSVSDHVTVTVAARRG